MSRNFSNYIILLRVSLNYLPALGFYPKFPDTTLENFYKTLGFYIIFFKFRYMWESVFCFSLSVLSRTISSPTQPSLKLLILLKLVLFRIKAWNGLNDLNVEGLPSFCCDFGEKQNICWVSRLSFPLDLWWLETSRQVFEVIRSFKGLKIDLFSIKSSSSLKRSLLLQVFSRLMVRIWFTKRWQLSLKKVRITFWYT